MALCNELNSFHCKYRYGEECAWSEIILSDYTLLTIDRLNLTQVLTQHWLMTLLFAGLFLSALTGGIIIPQISSFLLILETDDFDSINSENPYELPEQELLTPSASLVCEVRSHHVLQPVPQSTVSQSSFSLPVAEAFASVERM